MKFKKAQGMSVNVIIIAAIALIILVVLIAVFTGRFGMFSKGVEESADCDKACKALGITAGGNLVDKGNCASPKKSIPGFSGDEEDKVCCCG